jgi:catechol 2,3-dioxygenase-like lactoylglutathione lyase family enzyme
MQVISLDYVVLTVQNIERTCAFYSTVLGMEVVTFGQGRKALAFGSRLSLVPSFGVGVLPLCVTLGRSFSFQFSPNPVNRLSRYLATQTPFEKIFRPFFSCTTQ